MRGACQEQSQKNTLQQQKIIRKPKRSYFNSPKKQPLVRKMILDSQQAQPNSSCYQLRPIDQGQQSLRFYEQPSSSMKQISSFNRQSANQHQIDKIIYDRDERDDQDRMEHQGIKYQTDKSHQSAEEESQGNSTVKREMPVGRHDIKQYQRIVKVFNVVSEQSFHQNDNKGNKSNKDNKNNKSNKDTKAKQNKNQQNQPMQEQVQVKLQEDIDAQQMQLQQFRIYDSDDSFRPRPAQLLIRSNTKPRSTGKSKGKSIQSKIIRKQIINSDFQYINEFIQLSTQAALIQDLITIYGNNFLFQENMDFDSDQDQQIQKKPKQSEEMEKDDSFDDQVKIQQFTPLRPYDIAFNSEEGSQIFSLMQRMRIQQCAVQNRCLLKKQILFQKSRLYLSFAQSIQMLKPSIRHMSKQEKQLFISLKKQLKEIKDIIDYFEKSNKGDEHVCKICGEWFENGRQLGGHMSRKHPGKALQYGIKKELFNVKKLQRNRRSYFKKGQTKDEHAYNKMEKEDNVNQDQHKVKIQDEQYVQLD